MKNRSSWTSNQPNTFILIGVLLSLVFIVTDIVVDVYILGEGNVIQQIFFPATYELLMRLFASGVVFAFAAIARTMTIRLQANERQLERELVERQQVEAALRDSERREHERAAELQTIMDTVPAAIGIAHDQMCQVITGNRTAYELLHMPPGSNASLTALEDQRPVHFKICKDGVELPPSELPIQITAATGVEIRDFEVDYVFDDGAVVHTLGNVMPLFDEQGRPRGAVGAFVDITERKQVDEALRESETKLRSVIEQAWDGIALTNEQGRIIEWNRRAEQITRLSRLEAIGQLIWDIQFRLAPDHQRTAMADEQFRATLLRLLETGQSPLLGKLLNTEVQLPDGTRQFIEQSIFAVKTDKGYMLSDNLRDVTERQQAEAEIARLAAVIDQASDSIIVTDADGQIVYVNPAFTKTSGFSAVEIVGQHTQTLASWPSDKAYHQQLLDAVQNGNTWANRMISRRKDGGLYYEDVTIFPIRDKSGRIFSYASVKRDVTERQQYEHEMEAIAIIATALRAAPSHAEMMPVILYQMTRIMHLDSAALALKHAPTGEIVVAFATGDWIEWTGRRLSENTSITGQVINTRQPFVSRDAVDHWIDGVEQLGPMRSVMCVPLIESGLAFGALWIGHRALNGFVNNELRWLTAIADIAANALHRATVLETLERRVDERTHQLTEANQKLQELDRMKDQFVSNVSHELRTPLTSIMLQIELLHHGKPDKREVYLGTLRREADRLRKMIEDLLDLSRLDRNMAPIQIVPADLSRLLGQLVADRTVLAVERGLSLEFAPTADLPPAMVDVSMLTQVISNLVTNALNYTPSGGHVTVTTAKQPREDQDWVTFTVRDTGPGISAKDVPHLFERFYRGEVGRKASAPGTGLGLAICKEIVMKHGGQITVESEPGQGAVFTVWLRSNVKSSASARSMEVADETPQHTAARAA